MSPITIPTIGKRNMFFAIELRSEFDVGIIVKNEKTEPICLSNENQPHKWNKEDYRNGYNSKEE